MLLTCPVCKAGPIHDHLLCPYCEIVKLTNFAKDLKQQVADLKQQVTDLTLENEELDLELTSLKEDANG